MKYLYAIVYAILERCVHASEAKNNSCMQSFLVHPAGILFKHYASMDDDDAIVHCSSSGEPPPKRGRGGRRQKRKRRGLGLDGDIDPAGITAIQSKTYKLLAERFAKGSLSPQEVQRIAAGVVEDIDVALQRQTTFRDLTQMADIGNRGRTSQKAHSDIMKVLSSRYGEIETTKIEVPISMHTGENVQSATLPMLEPHCALEHLYTKEPGIC